MEPIRVCDGVATNVLGRPSFCSSWNANRYIIAADAATGIDETNQTIGRMLGEKDGIVNSLNQ